MYIVFDKETKKVVLPPSNKPFKNLSEYVTQAETEIIPSKYDYLEVSNVKEHTRVIAESYITEVLDSNEQGEEITVKKEIPAETEIYYTCDLVAKFRSAKEVEKQQAIARINHLKEELAKTDYQAIKYAEGWLSAEEYAQIKAQRQACREEINRLEGVAK